MRKSDPVAQLGLLTRLCVEGRSEINTNNPNVCLSVLEVL